MSLVTYWRNFAEDANSSSNLFQDAHNLNLNQSQAPDI